MSYSNGSHTVFHYRHHIVWITKYRYKGLDGALRQRIRTIIKQVCKELGVQIVRGFVARAYSHLRRDTAPHCRQRFRAPGQRPVLASRSDGVPRTS